MLLTVNLCFINRYFLSIFIANDFQLTSFQFVTEFVALTLSDRLKFLSASKTVMSVFIFAICLNT